jgi:hypothetical protein
MQHWTITREADGLATLTFDKAGATANTLSAAVLAELNEALDILDREPPKGLIIRSGKANGFIAGADVDEFGEVRDEAGAIAIVKRGWDTFERLARVKYPTLALVRGFCLGGGFELALACRYRVVDRRAGHAAGSAGSDARHRAGLGRHQAAAAPRRRAGGARPAAHRQDHRCAPRQETGHRRRMRAGPRSWRTRRAASCARCRRRAARTAAVADAQPARAVATSPRRPRSRSRSARAASTIRRRTRSSTCGSSTTAMRWPRRRRIRRRSHRC